MSQKLYTSAEMTLTSIIDGVGISSRTMRYKRSDLSSGVSRPASDNDWSTTPPITTTSERYLWSYEILTFTDGHIDRTTPAVIGIHGKEGEQGPKGEDAYRIEVLSRNGNTFKNGVIDTWLYAVVYKGDDDITDELDINRFRWERTSADPTSDTLWNQRYFGGTKEIKITTEDVYKRATFTCSITKQ